MGLLLVRHADAVQGGDEIDDAARWLSNLGREKARLVGTALAARGLRFQHFVASPRVRTVQTAELFAVAMGFLGPIEIVPSLSFTAPARRALEALARFEGNVAAFGHMPTIAELCGLLTRGVDPQFGASEAMFIEDGRVSFRIDPDDLG